MAVEESQKNFIIGEEVYVCSTHWGVQWAKKEFGVGYKNHYLIGSVKKIETSGKKKKNYFVTFVYDDSEYCWGSSLMSKFLFGEISADETHRARGYVVISGENAASSAMAEKGEKSTLDATSETIVAISEEQNSGM